MQNVKVMLKKELFDYVPFSVIDDLNFTVVAFKYKSGVEGLRISNGLCSMVVTPYMGHQIWELEINGRNMTQKSIFDQPLMTDKFGDNYGAFLIHCGLTNLNGAGEGENYPLHGELPFAKYDDNIIEIGEDEKGRYLSVSGTYTYRNSQEYYYEYKPKIKLYKDNTLVNVRNEINNKRSSELKYLFMCHMNWLGVDGSKILDSVQKDENKIDVPLNDYHSESNIKSGLWDFANKVKDNPETIDTIDFKNQIFNPEFCVNVQHTPDDTNWAHALCILPENDSYYVGFNCHNIKNSVKWFCKNEDENGLGFCLPTTGNNQSSKHQYENQLYNSVKGLSSDYIEFSFGYKDVDETEYMGNHIKNILERKKN